MHELALALAGGGIAIAAGLLTQLLTWMRERDARERTVRDGAYKDGVDACAEFIGASHLHLGRHLDVVAALARIRVKYPHEERPASRLDPESLRTLVHPAIEQVTTASARAEVLVAKDVIADCIHRMNEVHRAVGNLMREGNEGTLPSDWKRQADRLQADHDRASIEMVERLRELGAQTSYRQLS